MKKLTSTPVSISTLAALALFSGVASAQKRPLGPSAQAAARLKKAPPLNWIAQYLPDDRYKVAGRVWKFVAPEVGRTYYLPWSPTILAQLRRKPGSVIGFSSAREAEEAGYEPSGDVIEAGITVEPLPGAPASREIVLSDGISSVVLPGNWAHLPLGAQGDSKGRIALDLLATTDGKYMGMLLRLQTPGRQIASRAVTPENIALFGKFGGASGGTISNANSFASPAWLQKSRIRPTRFGGLRGSSISPPPQYASSAVGNMLFVGRGDRVYMFVVMAKPGSDNRPSRVPGLGTVLKTMRLS